MIYLQDYKYYEDRYDRMTVRDCLWHEESFLGDSSQSEHSKKLSKQHRLKALNLMLYFVTGEWYLKKDATIQEWMGRDRKRDEMYERTPVPSHACFICNKPMELFHKYLNIGIDKERDKMQFYFRCPYCHVGLDITDGESKRVIPWQCPTCKRRMKTDEKRDGYKITTKDWCEFCGYENIFEFDLTPDEPEKELSSEEEMKYMEDKLRFCLSPEEGRRYLEGHENMKRVQELFDQIKKREEERQAKLKKYPKGFPLTDGGYTCDMCKHDVPNYDNWYDKYGIKCMACQHALERKMVPLKYFKDTKSWYLLYDLKRKFSIHSQTALKYIRQGKLKVYVIPGENGSPTCYVFPKRENRNFFQSELK